MSTIVTRAGKGSPLTHNEVDANFNNLNNDKYQSGDSPSFVTVTASTKVATPVVEATSSAGGQLRNTSGTNQLAWGAGGGSNLSLEVATNINPANASVSIAPTGTGTVTINPATAGTMNNVAIGGTTAAAGTFTSATVSTGNLTFSSTGQRITGDMSNATLTSRLAFQTSTTDGATRLMVLPNGTSTTSAFNLLNTSDANNASYLTFACESTVVAFRATNAGTGTLLPMAWVTGGSERMRLDTSGNLGIGTASPVTRLHVLDALSGGQFIVANSETNSAEKYGTFATQHYTNAEEPALGFAVQSSSSDNNILIGGALGEFNAATAIKFYTAANNTTTSGTQRMTIDSSGNVGIGGTANAFAKVEITGNFPGTTAGIGHYVNTTAPNGMTANVQGFRTNIGTAAAAFTLVDMHHFYAVQGAFGATSAVTNQYGFHAASSLTGATNNYGFYSNIGSGSNRWNFYANGAANNYFAGAVGVNLLPTAHTSYKFVVEGQAGNNATLFKTGTSAAAPVSSIWHTGTSGDNWFIDFYTETAATLRGSITYNRGAGQVAYNVTSDVRLKENIADAADAGDKIDAMQVRQFDWKETGNHLDYGFVAQELHNVAPHAVSKPENEDAMWSVDYSKLVPILVKELQTVRARLAALEAK